jgi:positive phototaxis protein PixI
MTYSTTHPPESIAESMAELTANSTLEPTMPSETAQQYLMFHLPPNLKAMLPTGQLTEILNITATQIMPVPGVPRQVMGVCNWRGEILWLADLADMLGAEPLFSQLNGGESDQNPVTYSHRKYSVLVLQHLGRSLGLVVEQVNQMCWCDPQTIQPVPNLPHDLELSQYLQGYWRSPDEETLLVLNGQHLVHFFIPAP